MFNHNLRKLGLTSQLEHEAALHEDLYLARVSEQHPELYNVIVEQGELVASVSGQMI